MVPVFLREILQPIGKAGPGTMGTGELEVAAISTPVRAEFAAPKRDVMTVFGVSENAFDRSTDRNAITCKIIVAAILIHHQHRQVSAVADYLSMPLGEATKVDALFRNFFLIYAVPRAMDVTSLTWNLRKFFQGKEDRVDFNAFSRRKKSVKFALHVIAKVEDEDGNSSQSVPEARITVAEIIDQVSDYVNVSVEAIQSESRAPEAVHARRICMFAARHLTYSSFPKIGKLIGKRDHTTVLHACRTMEAMLGALPPPGLTLEGLLSHIAARVPDVAWMHEGAFARPKKREKAFNSRIARDSTYLEAA